MSTTEEPRAPLDERIPSNAVSVYGQTDAMDDFPVLKAFQQYIDAEQTKSRKRMVMLCIFFGCLMAVVIAVFIVMLHSVSERNQSLNDRFLEYMMQERDRAPVQQQPTVTAANPTADAAALKAVTDSIASLQKELAEQKTAAATKESTQPTVAKSAHEQELEALAAKRELLEAERKKIAEEKELLHQQEVERQRRRLYPEYYENTSKPAAATPSPSRGGKTAAPKTRVTQDDVSQQDIDDILSEAYGDQEEEEVTEAPPPAKKTAKKKAASAKKSPQKKANKKTANAAPSQQKKEEIKDTVESDDDAIEYFNDDEYSIPVEVKGSSSGWKVPLS